MKESERVSVVIPTLGGETLAGTIQALNRGTVVPEEILICIPDEFADRALPLEGGNTKILRTRVRGQVAQRAQGFRTAACPFVLQLDDDIELDPSCIANLLQLMAEKGGRCAVSPSLYAEGNKYAYPEPTYGWFNRFLFWILNGTDGFRPGGISRAGVNFAILLHGAPFVETEWVPGGCVLHKRENLVLENFYPLPGKAYAEDLFHSWLLRRAGVALYVSGTARASFSWGPSDPPHRRAHLRAERRVMLIFSRFAGKSTLRVRAYYTAVYLHDLYMRLRSTAGRCFRALIPALVPAFVGMSWIL